MEKVAPRPDFRCLPLENCWRQLSFDRVHEIPVELEHAECVAQALYFFAVAFCAAHKAPDAFADDAIKVLDVGGFDFFNFGVSEHGSSYFVDELSARVADLDELSVIDAVFVEELWHDECVVVIAVREDVQSIGKGGWLDAF